MNYKQIKGNWQGEQPSHQQPVIGLDEETGKEETVRYRNDSNRFFEHPYTGAVYPIERMNRWREK